jgi:septal ring-binding cell division protein DamX
MKPRQLNLFGAKTNKENKLPREGIIVPVDTAILLIVVIILLFVIAFSWGMERGRRLTLGALAKEAGSQEKNTKAEASKTKKIRETKEIKEENSKDLEEKRSNPTTKTTDRLYRIQVASFYKLSSANQEAKELKDKGYSVKIGKKGKYSVVYVGNFNDKKEAEKNLKKLKKTYQDCMLRVSD